MSPKYYQILSIICLTGIRIKLVSKKPGIISEDIYFRVISELNLETQIIYEKEIDINNMKLILNNILNKDINHLVNI